MAKRTQTGEEEAARAAEIDEEIVEEEAPADDLDEEASSSKVPGDMTKQLEELEELIRENPLPAIGIAAGAGLVLGVLLSRK